MNPVIHWGDGGPPTCTHDWHVRQGAYFGEPVLFKRCRVCKAFRWRNAAGKHFERVKATWGAR